MGDVNEITVGEYIRELEVTVEGMQQRNDSLLEVMRDARSKLVELKDVAEQLAAENDVLRDAVLYAQWFDGVHRVPADLATPFGLTHEE